MCWCINWAVLEISSLLYEKNRHYQMICSTFIFRHFFLNKTKLTSIFPFSGNMEKLLKCVFQPWVDTAGASYNYSVSALCALSLVYIQTSKLISDFHWHQCLDLSFKNDSGTRQLCSKWSVSMLWTFSDLFRSTHACSTRMMSW